MCDTSRERLALLFFGAISGSFERTGRAIFPPPDTKTIQWKNSVMETRIKPSSRRNQTQTYIIQKVANWEEERASKCTNAPDSPHLNYLMHLLHLHHPDSLQPTEHKGNIYPSSSTFGAGKTRTFSFRLNCMLTTSNFLSSTRVAATFQNKSKTPAGVPAGAPAGGAGDARLGEVPLLLFLLRA